MHVNLWHKGNSGVCLGNKWFCCYDTKIVVVQNIYRNKTLICTVTLTCPGGHSLYTVLQFKMYIKSTLFFSVFVTYRFCNACWEVLETARISPSDKVDFFLCYSAASTYMYIRHSYSLHKWPLNSELRQDKRRHYSDSAPSRWWQLASMQFMQIICRLSFPFIIILFCFY